MMDRNTLQRQTVETLLLWILLVIREFCTRFRVDLDRVVAPSSDSQTPLF